VKEFTCKRCAKTFKAKPVEKPSLHRLMCADSTDKASVERLMNEEKAGLMATDPPYCVEYHGGNHPRSLSNSELVKDKHHADYQETGLGKNFFLQFLKVALDAALSERPAIYQWHAHKRQAMVEECWGECGLMIHQQLIWAKARPVLTFSHMLWAHEPCFYGWIKGKPPARKPPATATTLWKLDQQGLQGIHPTEKPVAVFAWPMEWHLEKGEVAFEPFAGSGTSLVAAEQTGRLCYAIEKAPAFVACTLERLSVLGLESRRA